MAQSNLTLSDQIVRMVEINRKAINSMDYGEVIFRSHQGRLIEITATKTLKLSAGFQIHVPSLKVCEIEQCEENIAEQNPNNRDC